MERNKQTKKNSRLLRNMEKCFLCGAVSYSNAVAFKYIRSAKVPSSQKSILSVLTHLSKLINMTLQFHSESKVCNGCFDELSAYDEIMVNLMKTQKSLMRQLKAALTATITKPLVQATYQEIEIPMPLRETPGELDTTVKDEVDDDEEEEIDSEIDCNDEDHEYDGDKIMSGRDSPSENGATSVRKRKKRECETCGMIFTSKYQLQVHVNTEHNAQHSLVCPICGVLRRNEEYLELHMNVHDGKTENECRYCPKRFTRPVNTLRHMRAHWDKKEYQCEKCGIRFSQDHLLYNHRLRHEAEENPIICSICNISFKSRKTYNHHILIHQENRPRHHCTLCPKSFTERYTLKMHMKTHNNGDDLNMVVDKIEVPVVEEQVIEDLHVTSEETHGAVTMLLEDNDSSGFCVICSVNYQNKRELDQHLQVEHDVVFK